MGPQTRNIALIVVDMQNNFSDIMGDLKEKLSDLAEFMRLRGVPVIYTYHGTPDPPTEEDKDVLVAFWGSDGCIKCVLTSTIYCVRHAWARRTSCQARRHVLPACRADAQPCVGAAVALSSI